MILSESDKAVYFPFVELSGFALQGAMKSAQMSAESVIGRPLEITEFCETIRVPPSSKVGLRYAPVLLNLPITLVENKVTLTAEDYVIDQDVLTILNPSIRLLTARYWSGFDFGSSSAEVQSIKSAVAAILNYQVLSF